MSDTPPGCGKPATQIVFRGKTRRLFVCGGDLPTCVYEGGGRVLPYETGEDVPENRVPGKFTGPAKKCGEETQ